MRVLGVIPARYGSSRFPGKPLAPIAGKPMIQHVWERARQCAAFDSLVVATDDPRIESAVRDFGGEVVMTADHHPSGTDRLIEVAQGLDRFEVYVNIQGDEPLLDPSHLDKLVGLLEDRRRDAAVATLVAPLRDKERLHSPHVVKVVRAAEDRALYFSRSVVPHLRNGEAAEAEALASGLYAQHLGLYAYTGTALGQIAQLQPSKLELAEGLEQLRWLEAGIPIFIAEVAGGSLAVDRPEDIRLVEAELGEA